MEPDSEKLAAPALRQALEKADPQQAHALLYSMPVSWFDCQPGNCQAFVHLVRGTAGDVQAQVIGAVDARGPGVLEACTVAEHLVLAAQVGQRGSAAAVEALCQGWARAVRSQELLCALVSTLAANALTCHNQDAWDAIVRQDPSQLERSDRLRLAARRATSPDQVAWAMGHAASSPWGERVEVAWDLLRRAWAHPPARYPVQSPELATGAALALMESLPWGDADVPPAVAGAFNHARSPLRQLLENEFAMDPRQRQHALDACQPLVELLQSHGADLDYGLQALALAATRHRRRMGMASA